MSDSGSAYCTEPVPYKSGHDVDVVVRDALTWLVSGHNDLVPAFRDVLSQPLRCGSEGIRRRWGNGAR